MTETLTAEPGASPGGPLWISGLRPHMADEYWCPAVASILLLELGSISPSEKTAAAETGLGLKPCHYWYILRAEELFGQTVFLWSATIDGWQEGEGGCCPFDSGGLWHGHIETDPSLPGETARKMFFERYDQSLGTWHADFRVHLAKSYVDAAEYILGQPPRFGVPEILKKPPNTTQAWSWEVRVCRGTDFSSRLSLERVYWRSENRRRFGQWLEETDSLDDAQLEMIETWSLAHSRVSEASESPVRRATADLIEEFGR